MTITISCNNPYRTYRVRNYFCNQGVHTMLCNEDTEVSLFNLDRDQADFLLAAFAKHFHLKPATTAAVAS